MSAVDIQSWGRLKGQTRQTPQWMRGKGTGWFRVAMADAAIARVSLGAASVLAIAVAYILTDHGALVAGATMLVPGAAFVIMRRRGYGFLLAVGLLMLVPYWYKHVWLIAPVAMALGLFAGIAPTRLRVVDNCVIVLTTVLAISWLSHPELGISGTTFIQGVLPLVYYFGARLTVTDRLLPRVQWTLVLAGGVAACTVLFEAAHGAPLFAAPRTYQWIGSKSLLFRAGSIFGGSPTAATILAVVLLLSVAVYQRHRRLVAGIMTIILAGLITTFDRAGLMALLAGGTLLAILVPYRHWGRLALAALALSIPIYAVTSSPATLEALATSRVVGEGLVRSSTIAERANLAAAAKAVMSDSTMHLAFGRGFDALEATGKLDANLASYPDLWFAHHGPNNDYLRAILEQGIVGLGVILAWLAGALWLGITTCWVLPKNSPSRTVIAGLTAATLGYMVAAAGHDFLHNVADLSIAALVTGVLVSACTMATQTRTPAQSR
ncbi:MAG: hypothetical protein E6G34_08290 [Actinobacteria bacterium]|nr:MAG: hypothetical protein E6G34_08290 [Actinomycetota bacterium]